MKQLIRSYRWACFLLFILLPAVVCGERVQPSDFIYQGAFLLPDEFNWGARGLSFYPKTGGAGSLLVTGFEGLLNPSGEPCDGGTNCKAYFGEVSIPTPRTEATWETLSVATFVRPMTAFDGGLIQNLNVDNVFVSGIQLLLWRSQ